LEEQVRGLGFERDVADLVDDEQRDAAELDELVLQLAGVVRVGEAGRRGGDPMRLLRPSVSKRARLRNVVARPSRRLDVGST